MASGGRTLPLLNTRDEHTVMVAADNDSNLLPLDPEPVPTPKKFLDRPDVKGGPSQHGAGWKDMIQGPKDATNPDGIMVKNLQEEVSKYGDFCQMTYPNFKHFGDGVPRVLNPRNFIPDTRKASTHPASKPTWVDRDTSEALKYTMEGEDKFYIEATSGIYPGEFSNFSDIIRSELPKVFGAGTPPQSRNWIGYVAVSPAVNGERDLVIVFRGTQAKAEWISDIVWQMVPWSELDTNKSNIKVAKGFETMYRRFDSTPGNTLSVQGQVHVAVSTLLRKYSSEKDRITTITTTGHSLGGALASMCAFDVAWSKINRVGDKPDGAIIPVTAFTFEAPRVGNQEYGDVFETQAGNGPADLDKKPLELDHFVDLKMLRVLNAPDIVPKAPTLGFSVRYFLPWRWWQLVRFVFLSFRGLFQKTEDGKRLGFVHGGFQYTVDTRPLWDRKPPIITSYKGIWRQPWKLGSMLGQFHNLLLALYLVCDGNRIVGDAGI